MGRGLQFNLDALGGQEVHEIFLNLKAKFYRSYGVILHRNKKIQQRVGLSRWVGKRPNQTNTNHF